MKVKALITVLCAVASVAFGGIENARIVHHTGLAATLRSFPDDWVAYEVPTSSTHVMCCYDDWDKTCRLGGGMSWTNVKPALAATMIVAIRGNEVAVYSSECQVDAGGKSVHAVDNVSTDESLSVLEGIIDRHRHGALAAIAMHDSPRATPILERVAGGNGDTDVRGAAMFWLAQRDGQKALPFLRARLEQESDGHVREKAIFAISQVPGDESAQLLIKLARDHADAHVRKQALFWLGQRAEKRMGEILRDAANHDPEAEVRAMAVFAIAQRPRDEAIPVLAQLAQTHRDRAVRKKAIFWLSQIDDPRAVAAIEKIVLK